MSGKGGTSKRYLKKITRVLRSTSIQRRITIQVPISQHPEILQDDDNFDKKMYRCLKY